MEGLKSRQVRARRKIIADLAATDAAAFGELVTLAKTALKTKPARRLWPGLKISN